MSDNTSAFEKRANELSRSINPKVLPEEVEVLNGDLAALEALARPRIAVEWLGAGGSRSAYADVTDNQLAEAKKWRNDNFMRFVKPREAMYCNPA